MDHLVWRQTPGRSHHGQVCIEDTYVEDSAPIQHTLYWPVSEEVLYCRAIEVFPEIADGKKQELWQLGVAYYYFTRGSGERVEIRILGGGQAKAIAVEHADVAKPKVRAGIDTRFWRGGWQKYLKTEGWVYC